MTLDRKDYKSAIPQLEKRISAVEKVGEKGLANFDVLEDLIKKEIHERERQYLKQDTSIDTITVKMYYVVKDAGITPATDDVGWGETMPKLDYSNDDKVLWYMSKTFRDGSVIEISMPQQVQLMDGVFSFINSVSGDASWTTINGDTISTGRIQDHSGDNYFDLDDGTFNFGDGTHYVRQVGNGVEIKADLNVSSTVGSTTLSGMVSDMSDFAQDVIDINNDIDDLQNQIDGNITTWFYGYVPTLLNAPASSWSTDTDKDNHLGDLFYDTSTGYAYRFMKENSTYSWAKITDSDVTEALRLAGEAQDTADHKRRVFVSTPVPPYDIGDLWAEGSSGDIKKCKTTKADGQSYSASDWELASKYTDDTAVTNFASRFSVTPEAISSEVTATQDGNTLTTRINQNATTVKIQASKVQVDGTLIVGASDVDDAISNTSVGDLADGSDYSTTSQMNSAIATAENSAKKVATDYVTKIDNNGIYVSPYSQNPSSGAEGDSVKIDGAGMEVFLDGTSVAKYGETARIGKETGTSTNINIGSSAVTFNKGSTQVAKISSSGAEFGGSSYGSFLKLGREVSLTGNNNITASDSDFPPEIGSYGRLCGYTLVSLDTVDKYGNRCQGERIRSRRNDTYGHADSYVILGSGGGMEDIPEGEILIATECYYDPYSDPSNPEIDYRSAIHLGKYGVQITSNTFTPTITTSTGTLVSKTLTNCGNTMLLTLSFKKSTATSVGDNVYVGNLSYARERPITLVNGCGYYASSCVVVQITPSGQIAARVTGAQLSANSEVWVGLTYISPLNTIH